MSQIKQTSNN